MRHVLSKCSEFLKLSVDNRKKVVVESGRCLNCLGNHLLRDCSRPNNCRKCGPDHRSKHYFLLHDHYVKPDKKNNSLVTSRGMHVERIKAAYNRVTAARIFNPVTGKDKLVYFQHDPGSQLTFISSDLATELGLKPFDSACFKLDTLIGTENRSADLVKFSVQSLESNALFCDLTGVVHAPWSDDEEGLPHRQVLNGLKHFEDVNIFGIDNCTSVDVIIGNDNARLMQVVEERNGDIPEEPHAVHTSLGWLACGGKFDFGGNNVRSFRLQTVGEGGEIMSRLKKELWSKDSEIVELREKVRELLLENEEIGQSRSDLLASDMVEPNVKMKGGHYEVPVPLKANVNLPNNFVLAAERMEGLRKKALKQPDAYEFLVESIRELKNAGYVEPVVNVDASLGKTWYLPYFVTSQVKKRIVYDGKSQYKGTCVNDVILSGPDLLNSLVKILVRFRRGEFAMMADVQKCYFQIGVPEEQRDLFRILWFDNDDVKHGQLVPYRFCVHPWGLKSSSFVACLAIRKMVEENPCNASDLSRSNVLENMYMDDFICSVDDLDEASKVAAESIELFKSRGFNLVKWSANKQALSVLSDMDSEPLAPAIRDLDLERDNNVVLPASKTLGCVWDTESDHLRIQCNLNPLAKYTRRNMLSQVGQNWDPLGTCGPYFLQARLMLQQLAIEKFDWDQEVPESFVKTWNKWLCSLESLKHFALPRWFFANSIHRKPSDNVIYELHAFSDASNQAFCSVVYLRRLVNGSICVSFVLGKCTIVLANQSSWSIARKELVAAVNTTKLMNSAFDALKVFACRKFFWCDSRTVLQWIKNPDLRLNRFISRRVAHILLLSQESEWHYCSSSMNAADVGTRPGLIRKVEARDLWFKGPSFLQENVEFYFTDDKARNVTVRKIDCSPEVDGLDKLIERAP